MTDISKSFDVQISVVFPFLTKSLKDKDSKTIKASGSFNYQSPPQVNTAVGAKVSINYEKAESIDERVSRMKRELSQMIDDFDRVKKVLEERSKHIALRYDPELAQNESLADAEETLFGTASGNVDFNMYKSVLEYEEKIDRYISHQSIESEGAFGGVA